MDKCKRHAAVARATLRLLSFHLQKHFRNAGQRIDEHDAGGLLWPTLALAVCLEGLCLVPSLLLGSAERSRRPRVGVSFVLAYDAVPESESSPYVCAFLSYIKFLTRR
jgi:hypothetical protein